MAELARTRDWVMVRIKRETHAELRALGQLWHAAYGRGIKCPPPSDKTGEVSIDAIVQELLKRDAAKRQRSKSGSRGKVDRKPKCGVQADASSAAGDAVAS